MTDDRPGPDEGLTVEIDGVIYPTADGTEANVNWLRRLRRKPAQAPARQPITETVLARFELRGVEDTRAVLALTPAGLVVEDPGSGHAGEWAELWAERTDWAGMEPAAVLERLRQFGAVAGIVVEATGGDRLRG